MNSKDRHGTPPHNQQAIEDGAAILTGIVCLSEAITNGSYDREAAMERVMLMQIASMRSHGHARYTDIDDMLVGSVDAVQAAYGESTTLDHMGTCIAQIERACLAWDDVSCVLHGSGPASR